MGELVSEAANPVLPTNPVVEAWSKIIDGKCEKYFHEEKVETDNNLLIKKFLTDIFDEYSERKGKKIERIVDIGSGLFQKYLPDEYKDKTVLVDLVEIPIDRRSKNPTIQADANKKLPIEDEKYQAVTSGKLINYLENPDNLIDEMVRILEKDGLFCMWAFAGNMKGKIDDQAITNFYPEKVAEQLKSKGLKNIRTAELINYGIRPDLMILDEIKVMAVVAEK